MNSLNYSEVESRRFSKEIFRGSVDVFDIGLFEKFYKENDPDVLIVRIPVAEQHKLHQLNGLNKEVIFADTLVYYYADLKNVAQLPLHNKGLVFREANSTDKSVFEELIPAIFNNYTTHYFSNPLLDKKKITEGYIEWAINTISVPGNLHVLVYKDDLPIGFITCSYDREAEIVLNGVLPARQGKGIYTDMVRYVKDYFNRKDISMIKVSTQIQNFAVQKVWNREGFILSSAFVTIHLNKK